MKLRLGWVVLAVSVVGMGLGPLARGQQSAEGAAGAGEAQSQGIARSQGIAQPSGIAQPPGVEQDLLDLASEHATHTAFTFDRDMLQSANSLLNGGEGPVGALNSITFETYRYREPAFYIPEAMHALIAAYHAAGWQHLVNAHASPRDSATPPRPLTDLWLHFHGTDIDGVTALIRSRREMTVVEVSGELKPLDLLRLGGHFGIPKVDPGAVMVPAPPGR